MSERKVTPGRMMKATHFVMGIDRPVSCDSVDNLLLLANQRIAKLESRTPDPRIEAAKGLADALKAVLAQMQSPDAPWWMNCPDRGGFDEDAITAALEAWEKLQ